MITDSNSGLSDVTRSLATSPRIIWIRSVQQEQKQSLRMIEGCQVFTLPSNNIKKKSVYPHLFIKERTFITFLERTFLWEKMGRCNFRIKESCLKWINSTFWKTLSCLIFFSFCHRLLITWLQTSFWWPFSYTLLSHKSNSLSAVKVSSPSLLSHSWIRGL